VFIARLTIVARLLGHHSAAFTLSVYAHLIDGDVGEALDLDAEVAAGGVSKVSAEATGTGSNGTLNVRAEAALESGIA
jgi:hypothetical protein